jgi:hypothetical protein
MTRRVQTEVNDTQKIFVAEFLKHGNMVLAARNVGINENTASKWINHIEYFKKFLNEQRAILAAKAQYDVERAMKETEDGMVFARETGNANALAKLIELRTKLFGLLIEKHEVRQASLTIAISGIDPPSLPSVHVQEAEFAFLPPPPSEEEDEMYE